MSEFVLMSCTSNSIEADERLKYGSPLFTVERRDRKGRN